MFYTYIRICIYTCEVFIMSYDRSITCIHSYRNDLHLPTYRCAYNRTIQIQMRRHFIQRGTYVCMYICKWRDIIPIITGIALFVVRIRCLGFVTDPGHYFIIFGVMISRYSVMSGGELTTGRRGGPKFALKFASSSPWNADSNCEKKNKVTATNFQRNIQPFLW